jgi:hypothetical protein
MDDAGVKIVLETSKMVRVAMVLLNGICIGTMYKLQGSTISDGCNSFIVPGIGFEEEKTPTVSGKNIMVWHQILGYIREKGH